LANRGLAELADKVDTIITISNDKLLQVIDKKASLLDAFVIADDVLRQGVQGIAEIITVPGIVNADFADVKAVMSNAGSALMGIGQSSGENKAIEAAKDAINSKLLDMSIEGARGIVFTITGGPSLGMNEVNEAAKVITSAADEDAKIIFGAVIDEKLKDEIKITVVATGFDGQGESLKKTSFEKSYTPTSFMKKNEEKKENSLDERKNKAWSLGSSDKIKKDEDENKFKDNDSSIQKPKVEPKKQEKRLSEDDEDDELSVPAFIRKKMK
jgi:cell division protein FtsZ